MIIGALGTSAIGDAIGSAAKRAICQIVAGECVEAPAEPPSADRDGDGIRNADEERAGLDPDSADTDRDGLHDRSELEDGTDPRTGDTDADGVPDAEEARSQGKLDPTKPDTDGDGLSDGEEKALGTDPSSEDSDGYGVIGDGLSDAEEIARGTDPRYFDSDGDDVSDGDEVDRGSDPTKDQRTWPEKALDAVLDDPIGFALPSGAAAKYLGKGLTSQVKAAYVALRGAKTAAQAAKARQKILALLRDRVKRAPKEDPAEAAKRQKALDDLKGKTIDRPDPWKLDPKERGRRIEQEIADNEYRLDDGWWNVGATKGGNSPLIDFQRHDIALSLKTVDTRLKYAGKDLYKHIRELESRSIKIDGKPATKVLDIRVPPGQRDAKLLQRLEDYGGDHGVQVRISEYP